MIELIELKFGSAPGSAPLNFRPTPVTVFVGPNNSGKSRILQEIERHCSSGPQANDVILGDMQFMNFEAEDASTIIESLTIDPNPYETIYAGHSIIGSKKGRNQVPLQNALSIMTNTNAQKAAFAQWVLTHLTLKLDGQSRIGLVSSQMAGDLQQPAQSSLQVLFRDNAKRMEVRRIVKDAFGTHFVIDPTNLGQFRIRLSDRSPANEEEERGLHEAAVSFHSAAQLIDLASDGVKAFTGIVIEYIAGDPKILLIDEPEAFLHPALAFNLGFEISRASLHSDKRVFVSTHSASFVMGCIQSGVPVNIVRMTYRSSAATARILPSVDLLKLMRNPLLRSTNVLSGLFYEFVVVTESDADRAFYQEVNDRLLRFCPDKGIPNCLFLHAQNKQTVQSIIRPLRELGIPAAAIVDIDVLKEGGTNWINLMTASGIPQISHNALGQYRSSVCQAFEKEGIDMKRDGGVEAISTSSKEAAANLLQNLADYGTFVVPNGELECWLKNLGATGHGPNWLIATFTAMGEDPDDPSYVRPEDGDVWDFLASIKGWLANPVRKGIPA